MKTLRQEIIKNLMLNDKQNLKTLQKSFSSVSKQKLIDTLQELIQLEFLNAKKVDFIEFKNLEKYTFFIPKEKFTDALYFYEDEANYYML
jgi:hypothetical protein